MSDNQHAEDIRYFEGFEAGQRNAASEIERLREAVEKAAEQFDFYAMNHAAKQTPEADEKAATNAAMAKWMRDSLAPSPPLPRQHASNLNLERG